MDPSTTLPSPGQQIWVILLATGDLWIPGRQLDCITILPSSLSWTLPKAGLPVVRTPLQEHHHPLSSALSSWGNGLTSPGLKGPCSVSYKGLEVAYLWEVTWKTVWLNVCPTPVWRGTRSL